MMSSPQSLLLSIWGKSSGLDRPYPLIAHLLDTAATAGVLIDVLLPATLSRAVASRAGLSLRDWRQAVKVLAGWHDIGKASCGFQNLDTGACPSWLAGHQDRPGAGKHDLIGGCFAWDQLEGHQEQYRLAQIISGHHGEIKTLDKPNLRAFGGGAALVDDDPPNELLEAREYLWRVLDTCLQVMPKSVKMPSVAASVTLSVVILADWIASFHPFVTTQQSHIPEGHHDAFWPEHYKRAGQLARDHLSGCGLIAPPPIQRSTPASVLGAPHYEWRDLQKSVRDGFNPTGAGIIVISAPTGEGKTEAALIAAEKLGRASGRHGFYFAMPTVATAEGLHQRIGEYIERASSDQSAQELHRVHSQAVLSDRPENVPVSDNPHAVRASGQWLRGTRKTMLAPYGIGTIDQVLLGVLKAKHAPIRVLGASLGCLIVDEAHALDPYMRRLLIRSLEWLAALGTPVVILSATMPSKRVAELVSAYQRGACEGASDEPVSVSGYPTWVAWTVAEEWSRSQNIKPRATWEVQFETEDCPSSDMDGRIARIAVDEVADGKCVLVVRSTIRAAQNTYEAIRLLDSSLVAGESVEIIHSRMPQGVRRRRSEEMLGRFGSGNDRPERMILVATQVVEQSFDVDFDILVTDPAPVSALLQRAGRVWRHREHPAGWRVPVRVVWPLTRDGQPHKASPIYSKADLMSTRSCLTSEGVSLAVRIPDEVPSLVERADAESREHFDFDPELANEAEEATLAQLVRADQDMSVAENWAIPHPWEGKPLHTLTGRSDTDEKHPGSRLRALSCLVIPGNLTHSELALAGGRSIPLEPTSTPSIEDIRQAFDAAIPVSYPSSDWVDEMSALSGKWDRTPVGGALILSGGELAAGGYRLEVDDEKGLSITRESIAA